MRVIHWNKNHQFQPDTILPDWRMWAQTHHYLLENVVPVSVGNMQVFFEIYQQQDPADPDTYLLYHPPIGTTANTEVLCILPNRSILDQILQAEQKMAISVMKLLQQDNDDV